jgi:hypothetical protein
MRAAFKALVGLLPCTVLALALAGCSSEQLSFTLEVSASPNPVSGVADEGGRRWDYRVSIVNTSPVAVVVESYHTEVTATDTGYVQPLHIVKESEIIGRRIEPGETSSYDANRASEGKFNQGRERRIYHARGEDGTYYSGEVVIELQ